MIKIILDTNFLIYCAKEKLDYTEEIEKIINESYELVVPSSVIEELKKVIFKKKPDFISKLKKRNLKYKKTTGKDKEAASLALELLEYNKVNAITTSGKTVDDSIINLAKENKKNIVCTLDREMRHILGRVILINKGKKLILTK
ncbi:MAG: PIN domain-containing protein [Nanoarchaeota archaeon]|nr:PIN domain-containing protein [Nanoarchaeota archaeon]